MWGDATRLFELAHVGLVGAGFRNGARPSVLRAHEHVDEEVEDFDTNVIIKNIILEKENKTNKQKQEEPDRKSLRLLASLWSSAESANDKRLRIDENLVRLHRSVPTALCVLHSKKRRIGFP